MTISKKSRKLVKAEVSWILHTVSGYAKSNGKDGGYKLTENGEFFVEHEAPTCGCDDSELAEMLTAYAEALVPHWNVETLGLRLRLSMKPEPTKAEVASPVSEQALAESFGLVDPPLPPVAESIPEEVKPATCQGTTKAGQPCKAKPGANGYCPKHQPA